MSQAKKLTKSLQDAKEYLCDKYNITFQRYYGGDVDIFMNYDRGDEAGWVQNHELRFNAVNPQGRRRLDNIAEQLQKKSIRNKDTYRHYYFDEGKTSYYTKDYKDAYYGVGYSDDPPTYQQSRRKSLNTKLRGDHDYRRMYKMYARYGEATDAAGNTLADIVDAQRDKIQTTSAIKKLAQQFHISYKQVEEYINFYDTSLNNDEVPDWLKR